MKWGVWFSITGLVLYLYCRPVFADVNITSLSISPGTPLQVGTMVTITATASSTTESDIYYKFYYRPNYGTDEYEASAWVVIQDYSTKNNARCTFSSAGKYIIVVRVVEDPENEPADIPITGQVITVVPQTVTESIDDLSYPGNPVIKTAWSEGREVGLQSERTAEEAFAYDDVNYIVFSREIHATTVTTALHRDAIAMMQASHTPALFSEAIFEIFHKTWHMFGGFPLDGYMFKIRSPQEQLDLELSQGGVALDASDYETMEQAHEIIHAWNAKTISYLPDDSGNIFQLETWITEGMTIYLTNIANDLAVQGAYEDTMSALWYQYLDRIGTSYDVPYSQLAINGSATYLTGGEWNTMLGAKGNLLAYLFSTELHAHGVTLSNFLEYLYLNFGLTNTQFTQKDIKAAVEELTGHSLDIFFNTYLATATPLTDVLDGSFPLID